MGSRRKLRFAFGTMFELGSVRRVSSTHSLRVYVSRNSESCLCYLRNVRSYPSVLLNGPHAEWYENCAWLSLMRVQRAIIIFREQTCVAECGGCTWIFTHARRTCKELNLQGGNLYRIQPNLTSSLRSNLENSQSA